MRMTPLKTVHTYYESLVPGSRACLMEVLDPHVVLEVPEGLPDGRRSYIGLKAYLEDFLYNFYGTFDLNCEALEYLDAGEIVVTLGRFQGHALPTGVAIDVPFAHVWTVRDGYIIRGRLFTDTASLCKAATLPTPVHAAP